MLTASLVWIVLAQVPTTPLSGTVVGPGGEPVVGADLILVGPPSQDTPIVARVKSGEGGRFTLDRPTALAGDHRPDQAPILWAVKPGLRIAVTRFPEVLPEADEPVRIVLPTPGRARVRVEGPDGRPLGGVRVLPERLRTHFTALPDVVAELASTTTDLDGLAVIDAVAPDELGYVDVHSREYGIQGQPIVAQPDTPVVALRPVSTWNGRLTAKDPKHVRGWRVRARTWSQIRRDPNAEPQVASDVETTTDDEGRFTLAPMAAGLLRLDLKPPRELPVLPDRPQPMVLREGQQDTLVIPLVEAVTVTGLVKERGTGKPVPGVSLPWTYLEPKRDGYHIVKADEQGRYTFKCLPGVLRIGAFRYPPTHVQAANETEEDVTARPSGRVIELAAREALPAAPPLRGRVVDEAGQAVPGATVQASWTLKAGSGSLNGNRQTRTDAQGGFVLGGLGPDSAVTITARHLSRRSLDPLKLQAGAVDPVTITLAQTPALALAGRVLGPGGVPMAEIPIDVQFRGEPGNSPGLPQTARFEDSPGIKTGPDGTFRTPRTLERRPSEYRVEVLAQGFLPARTAWTPVPESDLLTFPDLTLKRSRNVRVVAGRVVDRAGQPVPGALVSQAGDGPKRTSTQADADGRFRLAGVAGGSALVFAEAPAFRFGGAIVGNEADPVEIRLARVSEPPIATLKPLPSPLSRAQERALARELLEPLLPQVLLGELGLAKESVIPALARVAPGQVLEMIENRVVAAPHETLVQVVLGQFEDDPTLAIATVEEDLDPGTRSACWLALEDYRPAPDRTRRENLLERALADARQVESAREQLKLLGRIADRWLELGARDRARPVLLEGQKVVAAWPRENWFPEDEEFADVLAAIDLPAALALIERREGPKGSPSAALSLNRHKGQAAIRVARIVPVQAERLIAPASPNFFDRPRVVLMAARAMAKRDPARARRVLETIDDQSSPGMLAGPALVPFGLGLIAGELAGTKPVEAQRLLDEAFTGLRKRAVEGRFPPQGQTSATALMAELLPVVERVEPERLAERIWLVAACRAPIVPEPTPFAFAETFALAMRIARYDRAVADVIAAPALERVPDLLASSIGSYGPVIPAGLKSLAVYDPRAIARLLVDLPEAARKPPPKGDPRTATSFEAQLRLAAAQILGLPDEARPRHAGRVGMDNLP